ncbi:hypothetical protein DFH09DRAFT_1083275 [Mycena vulgaris]|nr:hypothetical protein DFH09DRAFT_1083275 [Mycena vulgaris]
MSSIALTGTNHAEGEAVHLRVMRGVEGPRQLQRSRGEREGGVDVQDAAARRRAHVEVNVGMYAGLLQCACPTGVYEYAADDGGRVIPGNAGAEGAAEGWEELHPLQAVRHQGAAATVNHVDRPRGRRRAQVRCIVSYALGVWLDGLTNVI